MNKELKYNKVSFIAKKTFHPWLIYKLVMSSIIKYESEF